MPSYQRQTGFRHREELLIMIKNRKRRVITLLLILITVIIVFMAVLKKNGNTPLKEKEIYPHYGNIATYVSTTGTVLPQNRLEITPPINGRVEKILVKEGDFVKSGQTLIWMSSTDRAALIDAARAQGDKQLEYWENVYKPIPLVAPISGTVIVRALEPGQAALTTTAILVISDRLLVKANVDETDIGRVKKSQTTEISLDAYPDVRVKGSVRLIKFESTTVNNVTTYEVHILPDKVPPVFKSGMSANIKIYDNVKKNVLLIPRYVITYENGQAFVMLKRKDHTEPEKVRISTGLDDDHNVEILSGLSENDAVVSSQLLFIPNDDREAGGNPFMPARRKRPK